MTEDFISPELLENIKKNVESLKKQNPKLKKIFPIVVEGDEDDEKEIYLAFFKRPDFATFSLYISESQHDNISAMRTLAQQCFLVGDKELVDDDSLFIYGLMPNLGQLIETRKSKLVNLSNAGK